MEYWFGNPFAYYIAIATATGGLPIIWTARQLQKDAGEPLNNLALELLTYPGFTSSSSAWRKLLTAFLDRWFGKKIFSLRALLVSALVSSSIVIFGYLMAVIFLSVQNIQYHYHESLVDVAEPLIIFFIFYGIANILADFASVVQTRYLIRIFPKENNAGSYILPFIDLVLSFTISLIAYAPVVGILFYLFGSFPGSVHRNFDASFLQYISDFGRIFDRETFYHNHTGHDAFAISIAVIVSSFWSSLLFITMRMSSHIISLISCVFRNFQRISQLWNQDKPIIALGWVIALMYYAIVSVIFVIGLVI